MPFSFDNTYARLPERFFAKVLPTKVKAPRLVIVNRELAALLGLAASELAPEELAPVLAGNVIPRGAEPIALAYAGHQFGGFSRQLGDGRAVLLGEAIDASGKRHDVQLKGSGRTPFSRGGDGRAGIGPMLREYLVSESMAALGIPSTRALGVVLTGELVVRDPLQPGAVLTRVAASHLRVGTFEYFAAREDREALTVLVGYALDRHYPDAKSKGNHALALLECVTRAQANLVAAWLGVGFVHGVMNTDNSSISGETIDFGPCAFLDEYDPGKTFSSIDRGGRYAFANQPRIAQWNLARLAEAILPLIAEDESEASRLATELLNEFPKLFGAAYESILRAKIGLSTEKEGDAELATDLLERLASNSVDYTLFFRRLCSAAEDPNADAAISAMFAHPMAFHDWAVAWRRRLAADELSSAERARRMRLVNPAFIPRNHRIEEAIVAAVNDENFAPFETLVRVLSRPYEDQPEAAHLAEPPKPEERVTQTFCGT